MQYDELCLQNEIGVSISSTVVYTNVPNLLVRFYRPSETKARKGGEII